MYDWFARSLACTLDRLLEVALTEPEVKILGMECLSVADRQWIQEWQRPTPEAVEDCAHEAFLRKASNRPQEQAINAWDGSLTYAQLESLSRQLAQHLRSAGVGPEVHVPFCFEKSM